MIHVTASNVIELQTAYEQALVKKEGVLLFHESTLLTRAVRATLQRYEKL